MKRIMMILLVGSVTTLYSTMALAAKCNTTDAPKSKVCSVAGGGKGISKSICADGKWGKFGECADIVCPSGKTLEEGKKISKCVGKTEKECTEDGALTPCNISNGIGEKTRKCTVKGKWGAWNKCQLKQCNTGFTNENGKCKKTKKPIIVDEPGSQPAASTRLNFDDPGNFTNLSDLANPK